MNQEQSPAIFIDRDGVLLKDVGPLKSESEIEILPKVADALELLRQKHFLLILVTNQTVVARGILEYEKMIELNNNILNKIKSLNSQAYFDDSFICPHHPNASVELYRIDCDCRKPKSGMLKEAANKHQINLSKSIMIGDRLSDIHAGKAVDCKAFQILSPESEKKLIESTAYLKKEWLTPDKAFATLWDAANYIANDYDN